MSKYKIEGELYNTIKEISEEYGISKSTVDRRIKDKKSYPDWFLVNDTHIADNIFPVKLTINNTTFNTYLEVAEKLKTTADKVESIFADPDVKEWRVEEIYPHYDYPKHKYVIDGVEYWSLKSLSRALGISVDEVKAKLRDPDDDQIEEPHLPKSSYTTLISVEGRLYLGIPDAEIQENLTRTSIVNRANSENHPDWVIIGYLSPRATVDDALHFITDQHSLNKSTKSDLIRKAKDLFS